jgi:hypothetical protein
LECFQQNDFPKRQKSINALNEVNAYIWQRSSVLFPFDRVVEDKRRQTRAFGCFSPSSKWRSSPAAQASFLFLSFLFLFFLAVLIFSFRDFQQELARVKTMLGWVSYLAKRFSSLVRVAAIFALCDFSIFTPLFCDFFFDFFLTILEKS